MCLGYTIGKAVLASQIIVPAYLIVKMMELIYMENFIPLKCIMHVQFFVTFKGNDMIHAHIITNEDKHLWCAFS